MKRYHAIAIQIARMRNHRNAKRLRQEAADVDEGEDADGEERKCHDKHSRRRFFHTANIFNCPFLHKFFNKQTLNLNLFIVQRVRTFDMLHIDVAYQLS